MCIIYLFDEETHPDKSTWKKENVCLLFVFSIEQIPKIDILHMLAKKHPELIEGGQRLIAVYVLDSDEELEDVYIDQDGADFLKREGVVL